MKYISVDIETTRLVPDSHYCILSIGAKDVESDKCFHWVVCRTDHPDLDWDGDTHDWWFSQDQEEARHRIDALAPSVGQYSFNLQVGIGRFNDWLESFETENLMFVGWPASFDYPFLQIAFRYLGFVWPFNYRTIDVKSYACGKLGLPFDASRDDFPTWLYEEPEYPHDALSDATMQAKVFHSLLTLEKG